MRSRPVLATLAAGLLTAVPAGATEPEPAASGVYLTIRASLSALDDLEFEGPAGRTTIETEGGLAASAAIGYRFSRVFRTDLEIVFVAHGLDAVRPPGGPALDVDATVGGVAALANVYVDIPIGSRVASYLGGGAGVARLSIESEDDGLLGDDSDTVFAYQAAAGLQVRVTPLVSLFGGYRFFATSDPDLGAETEYRTHNIDLGVRFDF